MKYGSRRAKNIWFIKLDAYLDTNVLSKFANILHVELSDHRSERAIAIAAPQQFLSI